MMDLEVGDLLAQIEHAIADIFDHSSVTSQQAAVTSTEGAALAEDAKTAGRSAIATFLQAVNSLLEVLQRNKEPMNRRYTLIAEIAALERELKSKASSLSPTTRHCPWLVGETQFDQPISPKLTRLLGFAVAMFDCSRYRRLSCGE
jgi:hypothetical protein